MSIEYKADRSILLTDDSNTSHTQTINKNASKAAQDAQILAFFGAPQPRPLEVSERVTAIEAKQAAHGW